MPETPAPSDRQRLIDEIMSEARREGFVREECGDTMWEAVLEERSRTEEKGTPEEE